MSFWDNPILQPNRRWGYGYTSNLPDSAFLYIDKSRVTHKDKMGRSHPLNARYLPVKNANGNYDCAHLRNAISRAPQTDLPRSVQDRLQRKARKLYERYCGY